MTELYVKDSGSWREIKEVYVKDSGVWREIQEAYVKESGAWKLFFQALPSYTGVTSSNIGTISTELTTDFPDVILSAGPLSGATKANQTGAFEIIVAPGHRLVGDTGTAWNKTRRYILEVTSSGFSYSTASKYNLANSRGGLSTATANNNLEFERDVSSFGDGTVLEFNHPARWGNANNTSPSEYFDYTLPRATQDYSLYGAGGGGGSNNNNGDAGSGAGGDSGGIRTNVAVSKSAGTVVRIRVGQGGVGASYWFNGHRSWHPNAYATDNAGRSLFNNFASYGRGEKGTDSGVKFGSDSEIVSTGGGGGIASFNNNAVGSPSISGQNTGPGSPGGAAGSKPPFDFDGAQAGGNTGVANDVGDGGTGVLGTAGSGYDGACWIELA
jgi:hypothetical protein